MLLKELFKQQIIEEIPYSDQEVENNSFYRDFLVFLNYLETNSPKLTQTKNLKLRHLEEINELLIKKIPMKKEIGNLIFKIRSQNEMRYIIILDALANIMKIAKREKGRLRTVKKNKKFFDSLSPRVQFSLIWNCYIHHLSWAYLQYTKNGSQIAENLQGRQEAVWLLLKDSDIEAKEDWLSLKPILETIRKDFQLNWKTAYGYAPDLARWGIELVIFRDLLEIFDFVEINRASSQFKLTDLGRKVIYFQVNQDEKQFIFLEGEIKNKWDYYYLAMGFLNLELCETAKRLLKKAIEFDENFVAGYMGMTAVYKEEKNKNKIEEYTNLAYQKTREIFPIWPEEMPWGIIENRQYLRAICDKACLCHQKGNFKEAEQIYRLLLKMNPRDNQGVRYLIAGMFAGLKPEDVDKLFEEGDKLQNWDKLEMLVIEQNKIHHFW